MIRKKYVRSYHFIGVIRKCIVCEKKFQPIRIDNFLCSLTCLAKHRTKRLIGKRFGKLLVTENLGIRGRKIDSKNKFNFWKCQCDCGNLIEVCSPDLLSGDTKSCGCLHKKQKGFLTSRKHIKFYCVWKQMIRRCTNTKDKGFINYGARGIIVCARWLNFLNFKDDMYPTYKAELTIDRIDNNGNYCKENCRWIDRLTQSRNRGNFCYHINFRDKIMTAAEWAKELGIPPPTLYSRLSKGWNTERALCK